MPIPSTLFPGLLLGLVLPTMAPADRPATPPQPADAPIRLAQMQDGGMRPGRGGGPRESGGMMGRMGTRFAMIDADGDGAVSGAELLAWRDRVFEAMDADGDDALTREEFMATRMGPGADPGRRGPRYDEMQAQKAAGFDAMDRDGDGMVTRTQFTDAAAAMFLDADADEDGALTQSEFRSMHRRPARTAP